MIIHIQSETPFSWLVVVPVVVTAGLLVVCDAPLMLLVKVGRVEYSIELVVTTGELVSWI